MSESSELTNVSDPSAILDSPRYAMLQRASNHAGQAVQCRAQALAGVPATNRRDSSLPSAMHHAQTPHAHKMLRHNASPDNVIWTTSRRSGPSELPNPMQGLHEPQQINLNMLQQRDTGSQFRAPSNGQQVLPQHLGQQASCESSNVSFLPSTAHTAGRVHPETRSSSGAPARGGLRTAQMGFPSTRGPSLSSARHLSGQPIFSQSATRFQHIENPLGSMSYHTQRSQVASRGGFTLDQPAPNSKPSRGSARATDMSSAEQIGRSSVQASSSMRDTSKIPTVKDPKKSTANPVRGRDDRKKGDLIIHHFAPDGTPLRGPERHVIHDMPTHLHYLHEAGCFIRPGPESQHIFSTSQDMCAHAIVRQRGDKGLDDPTAWSNAKNNFAHRLSAALLKFFGCQKRQELPQSIQERLHGGILVNTVGLLLDWVEPGLRDHLLAMADFTAAELRCKQLCEDFEEANKSLRYLHVVMTADRCMELMNAREAVGRHFAQAEEEVEQFRNVLLHCFGNGPVFLPERAYGFVSPWSSHQVVPGVSSTASNVNAKAGEKRSHETGTGFTPPHKRHRSDSNTQQTTQGIRASRTSHSGDQSLAAPSNVLTYHAPSQGNIREDYSASSYPLKDLGLA